MKPILIIKKYMQERTIEQKTFFGMNGSTKFVFQDTWVLYSYRDREIHHNKFYRYDELESLPRDEAGESSLYFLLMGILFWVYGLITWSLFFIIAFLIFIFLYLRSRRNYISLGYFFYILKDKKEKGIFLEIKKRVSLCIKEREYKIIEYSNKERESERMKLLEEWWIITQEEYTSITKEIQNFIFKPLNEDLYLQEKEIIKKLLIGKNIENDFKFDSIVSENKYLPWWLRSISWTISLKDDEKYKYWFDWSKDSIDPITMERGYYTLGDSKEKIEEFWRSFFLKV